MPRKCYAGRKGRFRLSEKFRDRRVRLCASDKFRNRWHALGRVGLFRDGFGRRVGRDGFGLPKNLGIGGSAGTGRTGRFRPSEKFRDRRVGWDGSDGTVSAFRKI